MTEKNTFYEVKALYYFDSGERTCHIFEVSAESKPCGDLKESCIARCRTEFFDTRADAVKFRNDYLTDEVTA